MSHTTAVLERSYQLPHIKTDLMRIAFGAREGDHEEQLKRMSSVFSRRDPFSPLYLTPDDLAEFEAREDITSLRLALEEENDKKAANSLEARIQYTLNFLGNLKLVQKRNEYFKLVDDLRARGQSTAHVRRSNETDPREPKEIPGCKTSSVIGDSFQKNSDTTQLVPNLMDYLANRLPVPKGTQHQPMHKKRAAKVCKARAPTRTLSFLCDQSFATRETLSRHVQRSHPLEEEFKCPACRKTGHHVIVLAGAIPWAAHVEQQHGKQFTPDPYISEKPAFCLICSTEHSVRGFSLHFFKAHEKESQYPFECAACHQNELVVQNHAKNSWIRHAMDVHGSMDQYHGSILKASQGSPLLIRKRKRSLCVAASDIDEDSSRLIVRNMENEEFWVTGRDSD